MAGRWQGSGHSGREWTGGGGQGGGGGDPHTGGRHSLGVRGLNPGGGPRPIPRPMPLSSRSSKRCSPRIDIPPTPPPTAEWGTGKAHTRESNISRYLVQWGNYKGGTVNLNAGLFHDKSVDNLFLGSPTVCDAEDVETGLSVESKLQPGRPRSTRCMHFLHAPDVCTFCYCRRVEKQPELLVDETGHYDDDAKPTTPTPYNLLETRACRTCILCAETVLQRAEMIQFLICRAHLLQRQRETGRKKKKKKLKCKTGNTSSLSQYCTEHFPHR